jgi:hypothetical protein
MLRDLEGSSASQRGARNFASVGAHMLSRCLLICCMYCTPYRIVQSCSCIAFLSVGQLPRQPAARLCHEQGPRGYAGAAVNVTDRHAANCHNFVEYGGVNPLVQGLPSPWRNV